MEYLRVDTPIMAFRDVTEEDMNDSFHKKVESRYSPLSRRKKYLCFGYDVEKGDYKQSKMDVILSAQDDFLQSKITIYTMTLRIITIRVAEAANNDTSVSDEDKKEIKNFVLKVFSEIAENMDPRFSHEIDVYDELKKRFVLTSYTFASLDSTLRARVVEYCIRTCPVITKRSSAPIFKVEYRGTSWFLTWYKTIGTSQHAMCHQMFVGVPIVVMSECGLQYNVSFIFDADREIHGVNHLHEDEEIENEHGNEKASNGPDKKQIHNEWGESYV